MEDWKENALEYMCNHVKDFDWNETIAFIEDYWQNNLSDEENLDAFNDWREEEAYYERERKMALCDLLTGKIHRI